MRSATRGSTAIANLAVSSAVSFAAAAAARAAESPATDAVRRARDAVFARPEFQYADPEPKDSLLRRILGKFHEALTWLQEEHPVLFVVGLGLLLLLLAVLIAHIVWTIRVARRSEWVEDDAADLEAALRRLDPAPFRARAVGHAEAGRLEEAVRDLYTALLLALDRRGSVQYASHKALLDYRIEAVRDAEGRAALDLFAATYPPGSFGRRPPSGERFGELVRALDSLIAHTGGATARGRP